MSDKSVILLIDDDETVVATLKLVLRKHYRVEVCTDPAAAVQRAKELSPDVVISDVKMPHFDGFWVLRELRQACPELPVILNSAYQSETAMGDVEDIYRPFAYLDKNVPLKEFLQVIDQAVAQGRARR
ncbi:MAG TPA: response regulator [Myxococcota bacterium]|nr:response regulator [Myxococcota bacterium]